MVLYLHLGLLFSIFFRDAFRLQINGEVGAFTKLTCDFDTATYFLYDLLADWEAQASALPVHSSALLELAKVDKQLFDTILTHANSSVDDVEAEINETSLVIFLHVFPLFTQFWTFFHNFIND